MNKTIAKPLIVSAVLAAISGHASADCASYMTDLINYASATGPAHIQISMTVKQGNGLSSSSTPWHVYYGAPPNVAEIDWNGAYLTGTGGKFIYSDRFAGGGIGNPYNINSAEPFTFWVDATGYVWIYNQVWKVWASFQGQCANNVLYGWGAAIGLNNGGYPAMYVLSFEKIAS